MTVHRLSPPASLRVGALALTVLGVASTGGCAYVSSMRIPQVPGAASESNAPPQPSPGEEPGKASANGALSLDSSVAAIVAAPGGKDVLDRDLPGLTTHPQYPLFKMMSLKKIAAMSNGKITQPELDKVGQDLAHLGPGKTQAQ